MVPQKPKRDKVFFCSWTSLSGFAAQVDQKFWHKINWIHSFCRPSLAWLKIWYKIKKHNNNEKLKFAKTIRNINKALEQTLEDCVHRWISCICFFLCPSNISYCYFSSLFRLFNSKHNEIVNLFYLHFFLLFPTNRKFNTEAFPQQKRWSLAMNVLVSFVLLATAWFQCFAVECWSNFGWKLCI